MNDGGMSENSESLWLGRGNGTSPFTAGSRLVTSTHALWAHMGIEPAPLFTPAPFPQPVTASQMWLSTSDGHLPDCPEYAVVGHGSWHLVCRHGAVTVKHLAVAIP